MEGITPAWAGKSQHPEGSSTSCQDHPRVGGEKSQKSKKVKSSLGSPPRGRGKASPLRPRITRFGITPAWAGKSKAERLSRCAAWDHPRVGGEKRVSVDFFSPFVGSPPRGRGKDQRQAQNSAGGGITPAWAGKRGWMRATEITRKDHPRVGGEKVGALGGFI